MTRVFFKNLKFPKIQDPSIQDELILSETASNRAESKDAIRQLIFLWAGWRDPAKIDIFLDPPPACPSWALAAIHPGWGNR